jgi:hypothetical protein
MLIAGDRCVCIPYLRENGNGIVEGGGYYRHKIKNTDIMSIYFIIVKFVNLENLNIW